MSKLIPVLSHIAFNERYNGTFKQLPDHHLNKVTDYKRMYADLYFVNPDGHIEDEPEFNILTLRYTQFIGLRNHSSDLSYFKWMITALMDTVSRETVSRYLDQQKVYDVLREDIEGGRAPRYGDFINWMNLVTKKKVFALNEMDLLADYEEQYYQAMKLITSLLEGELFENAYACFVTVDNLRDTLAGKIQVEELPPESQY